MVIETAQNPPGNGTLRGAQNHFKYRFSQIALHHNLLFNSELLRADHCWHFTLKLLINKT
ncbi:hypothetical protein M23134_05777 [Microscilla marina ATCC 23134]|uniref:Uncharacterized protein n=1 Tax=Microscilla marina ATCC 23134 TaxID=313606 RepID=A1ZIN6_MICM2|nr:hypothetical protein M23134_05777 [Microscilla marina ATCC 23134]